MAAGPDGVRGSGPKHGSDVEEAPLRPTGCPDPRTDRSPSCCCPCKRQSGDAVCGSDRLRLAVEFAAHQHGPDDAGHLVGQRHRRDLFRLRASNCKSQGESVQLTRCALMRRSTCRMTAVAPSTSDWRKPSSPCRLILPSRCRPAVECSRGVIPSQAAKWRLERNTVASGTLRAKLTALIGPTPGIVANNRLLGSALCHAISL